MCQRMENIIQAIDDRIEKVDRNIDIWTRALRRAEEQRAEWQIAKKVVGALLADELIYNHEPQQVEDAPIPAPGLHLQPDPPPANIASDEPVDEDDLSPAARKTLLAMPDKGWTDLETLRKATGRMGALGKMQARTTIMRLHELGLLTMATDDDHYDDRYTITVAGSALRDRLKVADESGQHPAGQPSSD